MRRGRGAWRVSRELTHQLSAGRPVRRLGRCIVPSAISRCGVTLHGRGVVLLAAMLIGCTSRDAAPANAGVARAPNAAVTAPPPSDSVATIAAFEQRVTQIDRDTLRFDHIELPIALGAGTSGRVTAWRAGNVWQKLRVDGEGAGFHSVDTYWYSDGALLGARLETRRAGKRTTMDQVWFRDRALYRWRDPVGRHLEPAARSTQYEVQMLRARLDTVMRVLTTAELTRQRSR